MRFAKSLFSLIFLSLLVTSCSLTQGDDPGVQQPSNPLNTIQAANEIVRQNVQAALSSAAQDIGLPVQVETFEFVSRDDFSVASVLVQGFDQPLNFFDPNNRIVDLGVIYLNVPRSLGIPIGFYKVRAYILQSRAELIDATGTPIVALPLEKFSLVDGSNRPMIQSSGCDVMFIYNQPRQQSPNITVEVAVRVDWCTKLIGR